MGILSANQYGESDFKVLDKKDTQTFLYEVLFMSHVPLKPGRQRSRKRNPALA